MNFLKKWINSMVLGLSGFFGLILSLCTGMKTSYSIDASALGSPYAEAIGQSHSETTKAYEVLTNGDLVTKAKDLGIGSEFGVLKAFGVVGVIVSVLLIMWAIVLILKNLRVIKCESKAFDIVSLVMPVLFLIATIGLLVSSLVFANAQEDAILKMLNGAFASNPDTSDYLNLININASVSVGVYQPIILAISVIAVIIMGTFAFLKVKT